MTDAYYGIGDEKGVSWKTDFDRPPATGTFDHGADRWGGEGVGPPFYFPYESGVYALLLDGGNYYVGKTRDLERRMTEHFTGNGAMWTEKHPPERIDTTYHVPPHQGRRMHEIEERETIRYMKEHGPYKVRGSHWAHPDLDECPPLPESIRVEGDNAETLATIADKYY